MRQVYKVLFLALMVSSSQPSIAAVRYYNSWFCSGDTAYNQQADLSAAYSGIDLNTDTDFFCPAVDYVSSGNTIQAVNMYYKLGSTAASLSCTWYGWDGSGDYYSSSTRYSCSTVGGCSTSGQTQNTGYDEIDWSPTLGGGSLITNSSVSAPFYGMQCNVTAGGSFAFVFGYRTVTTN